MKRKSISVILAVALVLSFAAMAAWASGTCMYCGSANYGKYCSNSPYQVHVHNDNDQHCIFCGSSNYGKYCPWCPVGIHIHGSGNNKCIYCGSKNLGQYCPYAPDGIHKR
jgi:hypothetical protein